MDVACFALLGIRRIRRNALVFNYYWSRHFRFNDWFYVITGGKHHDSNLFSISGVCVQLEVVTCTLLHWFAPIGTMTTWFLLAVDRNSGWVPESCCSSWCIFVLSCGLRVLRYITKVSKYEERFLSVLSRFPNMKGFYWAVRIELSLSCNQLKNNFDLSWPKLSQAITYLSQVITYLAQAISSCPMLLLSCP